MKDQILNYLRTDRTFAAGVELYKKFGRNMALLRKFNLQGETTHNLDMLLYQLFRLTGEPESLFRRIMRDPVKKPEPPVDPEHTTNPESGGDAGTTDVIEATKVRIREEFPFLSQDDCPDVFKILVSDMLTAYEKYVRAHEDLFEVSNEQEAFEAADRLIDNYLDNRAIWAELEHFKKEGRILGEHPYFEYQKRQNELNKMSVPDLIKLQEKLEHNIWRNRKKLEDDPKPHLEKDRKARIADYERELNIVKGLLSINE